jgi:hypothetical protein
VNGSEFYKALQPAYAKWLESMDKADAINMAAEIAFVKEVMFLMDEMVLDVKVPDDMDPEWFLDECVNTQQCSDDWYDMFAGYEYFYCLVDNLSRGWERYKDEHGRKFDDEENH